MLAIVVHLKNPGADTGAKKRMNYNKWLVIL